MQHRQYQIRLLSTNLSYILPPSSPTIRSIYRQNLCLHLSKRELTSSAQRIPLHKTLDKLPEICGTRKVHYYSYVHKSPPLGSSLNELTTAHTFHSILQGPCTYYPPFNASVFLVVSFLQVFLRKICISFSSPICAECPLTFNLLDFIIHIIFGEM